MEREGYREQLESILKAFPKQEMLSVSDVAAYTGWGRKKVRRVLPFCEYDGTPALARTELARCLVAGRCSI